MFNKIFKIKDKSIDINDCQITICSRLSLRYRQTNYKNNEFDIDDLTFDIRYNSSDTKNHKNVYSIKIKDYGWQKAYIIAINLTFVANVSAENKYLLSKDQMIAYENLLANQLLINIDEFIDLPLMSNLEQLSILSRYSIK